MIQLLAKVSAILWPLFQHYTITPYLEFKKFTHVSLSIARMLKPKDSCQVHPCFLISFFSRLQAFPILVTRWEVTMFFTPKKVMHDNNCWEVRNCHVSYTGSWIKWFIKLVPLYRPLAKPLSDNMAICLSFTTTYVCYA